jgi:hypothetical protein
VLLLLVGLAILPGACRSSDDVIRAALAAETAGWQRELRTLADRHAALAVRVPPPGREGPGDRRLRATLDGFRQSMADVNGQMRQIAPRVEQALKQTPATAQTTLEKEAALMDSYLRGLAADLNSAEQQSDLLAADEAHGERDRK